MPQTLFHLAQLLKLPENFLAMFSRSIALSSHALSVLTTFPTHRGQCTLLSFGMAEKFLHAVRLQSTWCLEYLRTHWTVEIIFAVAYGHSHEGKSYGSSRSIGGGGGGSLGQLLTPGRTF